MTAKRSRRPCTECGASTATATFVCGPCLARGIEPLVDGRWVADRHGIQRWVPNPKVEIVPPPEPPKEPRTLAPVLCGTNRGYNRHKVLARRGEEGAVWPLPADDPCGCRAAHRAHEAFRMAMRPESEVA